MPKPTRNARSYRGLNPCQWPLRLKVIWPSAPLRLREARPFRRQRSGFLLQRTTAPLTENALLGIDNLHRRRGKAPLSMEANMPGDPKECRQHAERCAELARIASTSEARETFLDLQMKWIRLAMELTQAKALIEATKVLEEQQPIKAAA